MLPYPASSAPPTTSPTVFPACRFRRMTRLEQEMSPNASRKSVHTGIQKFMLIVHMRKRTPFRRSNAERPMCSQTGEHTMPWGWKRTSRGPGPSRGSSCTRCAGKYSRERWKIHQSRTHADGRPSPHAAASTARHPSSATNTARPAAPAPPAASQAASPRHANGR